MSDSYSRCATTQWTLVMRAATEDSDHGRPALEQIVQRYWKPLYSFARQRGFSSSDAEDATQEFLSNLLDRQWLKKADPAKGKFRSYLLTSWKQFLIDQYRREQRQRRGGGMKKFSLDVVAGERVFQIASAQHPSEDRSFLLAWANNILEVARQRLTAEYTQRGNLSVLQSLGPYLTTPIDTAAYQKLAVELSISSSALRVTLHRLRQRFGETLREVVRETVESPEDVDQEIYELLEVLSGRAQ